ncbi:cation transporter [Desulfopila sp. IMCC35006]|uniref:cation diffusion facilitator family transporter n=1 Tax=Desulfopila sp. IMCC35006 TaxID=2569542 RepID=UPI0010AD24F3|nr:cation diffusion facilitator family transporter [Desulfopila sp. IMCC35006]TKB28409.1 cation transporter [Desulfopila sp. IMCC35006]
MMTPSKKVIYAALIGNCLIAISKFTAAVITGSSAMLSEAFHSVADTGNEILLLYGLQRAKMPADSQFPFGHGKEIYFWSFVVAMVLFAGGAGLSLYKGIDHLISPVPVKNSSVNYGVICLALIFEGTSWYIALKEFNKSKGTWGYIRAIHRGKDPSIFIVLMEDSAAILGLGIAFLGILVSDITGSPAYDAAAAVIIGLILAGTALLLASETKSLLIGESANKEVVQGIREIASSYKEIKQVNEVLTMHMGPDFILVNISVDFVDPILATDVEVTVAGLDRAIKQAYPHVQRIFIEIETWQAKEKHRDSQYCSDTLK